MDLDAPHFRGQLKEFSEQAKGADVALIYYAGHGILNNGENWMIPIDASLKNEENLDIEAVNLSSFNFAMQEAKVRIIIVDACRDNPFRRGWVSSTRAVAPIGLGPVQVDGELVIFSAAPGQEAQDGTGTNSPFAEALARRLVQPDLPVQLLGNAVRDDVINLTANQQRPFINASMSVTLAYLSDQSFTVPVTANGQKADADMMDALSWQGALRADTLEAYTSYRDNNPGGHFAKLAAANIKRLDALRVASQPNTAMRTFSAQDRPNTAEELNAYVKHQVDARDNAQDDAMKAYREQMAELAKTTAEMNEQYKRKVNDFNGQQLKYEADQKDWRARAEACKHGNSDKCTGQGQASPVAATTPSESLVWREALIVCRLPSGEKEARSDCQGPLGAAAAILGTREGDELLLKLCDNVPNYRDLGVAQGMRMYGCGFGLNPYAPAGKKGNLDVATALNLESIPGRLSYRCADRSTRFCRLALDEKPR